MGPLTDAREREILATFGRAMRNGLLVFLGSIVFCVGSCCVWTPENTAIAIPWAAGLFFLAFLAFFALLERGYFGEPDVPRTGLAREYDPDLVALAVAFFSFMPFAMGAVYLANGLLPRGPAEEYTLPVKSVRPAGVLIETRAIYENPFDSPGKWSDAAIDSVALTKEEFDEMRRSSLADFQVCVVVQKGALGSHYASRKTVRRVGAWPVLPRPADRQWSTIPPSGGCGVRTEVPSGSSE